MIKKTLEIIISEYFELKYDNPHNGRMWKAEFLDMIEIILDKHLEKNRNIKEESGRENGQCRLCQRELFLRVNERKVCPWCADQLILMDIHE